jgi:catechol 2,3-dioxygenase-like lactoylglutathione lyase family enzyme
MKLEVVVLPVADVDRAKRFYESLGCRLDADFAAGEGWRLVQMTSRLTVLNHVRQGIHDRRAGLSSGNVPGRR